MPVVTVNDLNMYYEIHGEGEPLVLIAGLATDVTAYERLIAALSQRYRVIAFDNRGVGRTDKPDIPYSIDMMAEDTAGLLTALGIGRAHVLGVSMGGRIAVALALRHPDQVKSLILVSTFVKRIPISGRRRLIDVWLALPWLRTLGDRYPQPRYAALRQRQASANYDASDRLQEIRVPTLILHGKKDAVAPYQLAEEMYGGIRGSQMIAFDGGHLFLFFRQQQFVDAVCAFLDSQTARPTQNG
jgi:3-oxoadipate enol-lactonase